MIRSLRQRHRITFSLLAVALPLLYVLALAARKPHSPAPARPDFLAASETPFSIMLREELHTVDGMKLTLQLVADANHPSRVSLKLALHQSRQAPDTLVYWCNADATEAGHLPAGAFLLGGLDDLTRGPRPLPAVAREQDGHLIFYSMGYQEVVATMPFSARFKPGESHR